MKTMKMAVDLLWVRPRQVGGIESYIRNLLDGFIKLKEDFELWLIVSEDNFSTFQKYKEDSRFHLNVCHIRSANIAKRIIWQNIYLGRIIKGLGISICFEPYYCKPFLGTKNIKFITTIHDLQAIHYPEYFSVFKVLWMKLSWKNAVNSSECVIAISNFVKEDIIKNFKAKPERIKVIYNPILIKKEEMADFDLICQKYGIEKYQYYFSVSSLLPHKNVKTMIKVINKIKQKKLDLPIKLIISGVGGKSRDGLLQLICDYNLTENVILTEFIENGERNVLYKYCRAFLFPSLFEGFGMPPVEAIFLGVPVITTKCACLPEVTQNKAYYVDNPLDVNEWIYCMSQDIKPAREFCFINYDTDNIVGQYFCLFKKIYKDNE